MSKTYTRYFRVTSGPIMDRAVEIVAANAEARKAVAAFCEEIGATESLSYKDGRRAGFKFPSTPDQSVWKQPNSFGAHMPRKNSAAGREMLARIEALPRILHIANAIEAAGLCCDAPLLISDRCGHFATITGHPSLGVLFIGVPWSDIDPKELDAYKAKREAGERWSIEMDHLCWTPSADMRELKRWEVEKEIDELNARIAREKEEA